VVRVGSGSFSYDVAAPWALNIEGPNSEVAGVAVSSKDEVHVFTRSPHPVLVFDRQGRFLRSFGEGVFANPHGIHIGADDCVYAADAADSTVRKFSPKGELLFTLGVQDRHSETGYHDFDFRTIDRGGSPFHFPTNAAVAPTNEIYVSDGYGNARIHRFSEDGKLLQSWGGPGRGPGEFRIPHSVFVDRHGTVYVADRENSRVQLFSLTGEFISEWTDVRRPDDVFVTADDVVYVAEQGMASGLVPGMDDPTPSTPVSRVTVRDLDGRILSTWGADERPDKDPCAPGNFFAAHGIWVDRHDSVYVGEVVVGGNGREGAGGGAGWVPPGCHALQVFHRA
jgi:DNA-binding beta-propeller fold protein YncE